MQAAVQAALCVSTQRNQGRYVCALCAHGGVHVCASTCVVCMCIIVLMVKTQVVESDWE